MNTDTPTMEAPSVLTEVKALSVPDMAVMTRSADSALRMAQTFVIANEDDYQLAGDELAAVKGRINKLEATRTGITGPMNKALDAINALFKGPMGVLKSAEASLKTSMLTYHEEQERKAAEARRVAAAAAEAERQRIAEEARKVEQAAAAERQRIAAEAARVAAASKAEQDRLAQEAAAAAAAGNGAAAAEAERAAAASRLQADLDAQQAKQRDQEAEQRASEFAAAMRHQMAVTSAAVTSIDTAKAKGTSVKVTVDYEVTSLISLVKHISENPALISLVMEDSVKLRAYVRSMGLNANLPGVRVFSKNTMSAKAA